MLGDPEYSCYELSDVYFHVNMCFLVLLGTYVGMGLSKPCTQLWEGTWTSHFPGICWRCSQPVWTSQQLFTFSQVFVSPLFTPVVINHPWQLGLKHCPINICDKVPMGAALALGHFWGRRNKRNTFELDIQGMTRQIKD